MIPYRRDKGGLPVRSVGNRYPSVLIVPFSLNGTAFIIIIAVFQFHGHRCLDPLGKAARKIDALIPSLQGLSGDLLLHLSAVGLCAYHRPALLCPVHLADLHGGGLSLGHEIFFPDMVYNIPAAIPVMENRIMPRRHIGCCITPAVAAELHQSHAVIRIAGRDVVKKETLADPGVEIPEAAAKIHGITTEKARAEGRPHDEVLHETVNAIKAAWDEGFTLIVYNAPYDLSVLRNLTGDFTVTGPVFDPYLIDRVKDRYRKGKRTLGDLCREYKVTLDNAHEATADALAAARIAWKQVNQRWPELKDMDSDELMEFQAVNFYDLAVDQKKYFEGIGRDVSDFNMSWPLQG